MDRLLIILLVYLQTYAKCATERTFPSTFQFGASTSAYQIEGGWNASGKGQNIWDYNIHKLPQIIMDHSNGDIACDSYNQFDEDLKIIKELGLNYYRFSISWSRMLPNATTNYINQDAIRYYTYILDQLKMINVDAMVTILHFDIPFALLLDEKGNVEKLNWDKFLDAYVEYARLLFMLFGSKVKYWTTFNEPREVCVTLMPLYGKISLAGTEIYKCTYTILMAHAKTYHIYQKEFRKFYQGKISMTLNTNWNEPATKLEVDQEAAERKFQFEFGWYANPLVYGDYPAVMKSVIKKKSIPFFSRLHELTTEEKELIKGTYDFIGVNTYTSCLVEDDSDVDSLDRFTKDMGVKTLYDNNWENTTLDWLKVVPWGFKKLLVWIDKTYNHPDIIVTENGYVDGTGNLDDDRRVNYYAQYLDNALDAIYEHNVSLIAYSTWSLIDNFEWTSGYTQKFGLYQVNFNSSRRERTPKSSAKYYAKIIKTKSLSLS